MNIAPMAVAPIVPSRRTGGSLLVLAVVLGVLFFWSHRGTALAAVVPVKTRLNVVYCTGGGSPLHMDTYEARHGSTAPRPVVVFFHGGGWRTGDKLAIDLLPERTVLLKHGYFVASVNYRLAPRNKWPAFMEDAKCAIRHVRASAARYHVDPHRIAAFGASAGGHVALLVGLTGRRAWLEGTGGYEGISSQVNAVASYFAPSDLTLPYFFDNEKDEPVPKVFGFPVGDAAALPTLREASPINHVAPGAPPIVLFHGDKDRTAPPSESRNLYERLVKAGVPTQFTLVRNAGHGFVPTPLGATLVPHRHEIAEAMATFLDHAPPTKDGP